MNCVGSALLLIITILLIPSGSRKKKSFLATKKTELFLKLEKEIPKKMGSLSSRGGGA